MQMQSVSIKIPSFKQKPVPWNPNPGNLETIFNMKKTTFKFGQEWRFTLINLTFRLISVNRYLYKSKLEIKILNCQK